MKTTLGPIRAAFAAILTAGILAVSVEAASRTQPQPDPATHTAHQAAATSDATTAQLAELRAKLSRLEATLASRTPPAPGMAGMNNMPGMGGMSGMSGMSGMQSGGGEMAQMMGMMNQMMNMMGNMIGGGGMGGAPGMSGGNQPAPMQGMGGMMAMDMMEMGGMGGMGGNQPAGGMPGMGGGNAPMPMMDMDMMMGANAMGAAPQMAASSLPGFPGRSHLYHVGSSGFFLNHAQHISLSSEQTARLNGIKENAMLAKSTADRAISQAEQEVWVLTSADQPDAAKIEEKVRAIEKLRADQRIAFIHHVGDAAAVLDDQQRQILSGTAHKNEPAAAANPTPSDPHAAHAAAKP
jgi:hypothetical protein